MRALLALACQRTELRHRPVCQTPEERKALTDAVIACAKAGNPMSDEEGEDLVAQCEKTMARAVCPERRVIVYLEGNLEYDSRVDVSGGGK